MNSDYRRIALIACFHFLVVIDVSASEINQTRALYNYQMSCQGCHTPDGTGGKGVPKIKDFIGTFLLSEKGREYLVQVPGSANSVLSDIELAEVLNWMIKNLGGSSVPTNMKYYSAEEVGRLRQNPLFEVIQYRKEILKEMAILNEQT